jgi:preprotein translocase subunit SecG
MKEEGGVLRDVIGTAQLEKESKTKKYLRIGLICIAMAFFLLVFVMAYLRRYGS